MKIIYNISILTYQAIIWLSSIYNPKAKLWIKGRRNIFTNLEKAIKKQKNIVWFHCASLGEYEQGKPIIIQYKKKYPNHKILLTFFSPSGYEKRKNTTLANFVFYLPLDTKSNANQFIRIANPIKVIFIKYEFWFNYMNEIGKNNIPLYSVSTIFRKNQLFFKYKWFKKQLKNITHFFVQDHNSEKLLKSIGFKNITLSGDSRFDTVRSTKKNSKKLTLIDSFCENKKTVICGSTWPKDEKLLIKYIQQHPQNNYIIAPHEIKRINLLMKKTNGLLYSKGTKENIHKHNVLIIDSIGLLPYIYQYGDIAYIGGGFGNGIHNILEALTFGMPVVFGPNYTNFKEAKDLLKLKGAICIRNYNNLSTAFNTFQNYDNDISINYIENNCGATNIIISKI